METTYFQSYSYQDQMAKLCISIIEAEVELFFASCKKSAYAYSLMIAKDINDYSYENFERIVLSTEETRAFIKRLICKLNIEMNRQATYFNIDDKSVNMIENMGYNTVLDETIESFKTTQNVIKTCEKVINTAFTRTFKAVCSNSVANYMFKKINFGERIFGGSNYKSIIKQHQQEIHKQIDGMLTNMKINIRNHLIESVIESLQAEKNYAIA